MKCVCPMGGDRACPDDCPLAVWASLSETDRKAQRKSVAAKLYKQGFAMEQIATQLGVGKSTIARDIEEFSHDGKTPPRPSKRGRSGEGRPKGSKHKRAPRSDGVKQAQRSINAHPKDWENFRNSAKAEGKTAADKLGELIVDPVVDPTTLSITAQQKLGIALKQERRKLEVEIEKNVRAEVSRWLTDDLLPLYRKNEALYKLIIDKRKGVMSASEYKMIWSCLHADSRKSVSDEKLNKAFNLFTKIEKLVLDEKESPTAKSSIGGAADLLRRKAEWDAQRAAERASKKKTSASNIERR